MEVLFAAALAGVAWWAFRRWRIRQRRRIAAEPLPPGWRRILEDRLPLYHGLPDELRKQLHGHIQLFLHDKRFYGFQGLEITEEMRLIIAGTACLLLLNRPHDHFGGFSSIYVYPGTFVSEQRHHDGLLESRGEQARLGESWHRGPLVLAWDAVEKGVGDMSDGRNVVLHEFAHKLDGADGAVDGAPILPDASQYAGWARLMQREYQQLQHEVAHGTSSLIDHYGATAPAEFFAVLVELFYEKPDALQNRHPELYAKLVRAFRVDPADWHARLAEKQGLEQPPPGR